MNTQIAISTTPSMADLIHTATLSLPSPLSRRAYSSRLRVFLAHTQGSPLNRLTVDQYMAGMRDEYSISACNQSLAAIKRLAQTAADYGALDRNTAISIQTIKGRASKGVRAGNWLGVEESKSLIAYNNGNVKSSLKHEQRDRVIIALLLGCGLRRAEACKLRWPQIQYRDGRQVIVDLVGKGDRVRTVPIPKWANELIREWRAYFQAIDEGYVLRPIHDSGAIGNKKLCESAVWKIVQDRGRDIGIEHDLAPHDLRRTFAKLSRSGGAQLEQIQLALGHASVTTTEKYLGTVLNVGEAACDKMGI